MTQQQLSHILQILSIDSLGPKSAGKLIQMAGSPESVQELDTTTLREWGISSKIQKALKNITPSKEIERELRSVEKDNIRVLGFWEDDYPSLLRGCPDAPVMLFGKGEFNFNPERLMIAIVGTRSMTPYGRKMTEQIVETLAPYNPIIISGLASGVDGAAHQAALDLGLDTVGVLGQGLGTAIFPAQNRPLAHKMIHSQGGGILSEFTYDKAALPGHFPFRNRIVAGMCHATILVEAKAKAGALITAELAYGYNREVFAVPGRVNDMCSAGCNSMISRQRAIMLHTPEVLISELKLSTGSKPKPATQAVLFAELTEQERPIIDILSSCQKVQADELCSQLSMPPHKLMPVLLDLELKGMVEALPGKYYALMGRV